MLRILELYIDSVKLTLLQHVLSIYKCFSYSTAVACRSDEFQCQDRNCIPSFLRCDGTPHCADNTDEYDCPPGMIRSILFTQCGNPSNY